MKNKHYFLATAILLIILICGISFVRESTFFSINCDKYGDGIAKCDAASLSGRQYTQIILYGQSLGMGWESPEAITTAPVKNCFMVGSSPHINHGNDGSLAINPLKAVTWEKGGEEPIVAMAGSLAWRYNSSRDSKQSFIATCCGEGGKSIEQLMKQQEREEFSFYKNEFLNTLEKTKLACNSLGSSVACPAIVYMQGEYNYIFLENAGFRDGENATSDVARYKSYLLQLKNDMQSDVMRYYNQNEKPIFFIYQVAGDFIHDDKMTINRAQIEFAEENDDVVLLSSTYFTSDYDGGHLSTNGYRWYGEQAGKQMFNYFQNGETNGNVVLKKAERKGDSIVLDFKAPVLPLVLDDWTVEHAPDYGFGLYANGKRIAIDSITVSNDRVIINSKSLPKGKVLLTYAGKDAKGTGNLRDSEETPSLFRYFDDRLTSPDKREDYTPKTKDGGLLYGMPYPLYNWCNHIYIEIDNLEGAK